MRNLLEELKDWGCDIDGAMERLDNDTDLYHTCLIMFRDDPSFEALGDAIRDKNLQGAFDQAHTIKGVSANLGLTPLWQDVFPIVELYRAGKSEGGEAMYAQFLRTLRQFRDILARY